MMEINSIRSSNAVLFKAGTPSGLYCLSFEFDQVFSEESYTVKIINTLKPQSPLLSPLNADFVQFLAPRIKVEPYVLIKDGSLNFQVEPFDPRLEGVMKLKISINDSESESLGLCMTGPQKIILKEWLRYGISFMNSDLQNVPIRFEFQFWNSDFAILGSQHQVTFVDRYRMESVSYKTPGLPPQQYKVKDMFLSDGIPLPGQAPITIVSYPNPYFDRTWQCDKRYLQFKEAYQDLLTLPPDIQNRLENFELSLEYDTKHLELKWNRLDHVIEGDSLLHIKRADQAGEYNVTLCMNIADILEPNGRAQIRIPLRLIIVEARMEPTGLGIDFGTSRTMVSLYQLDTFTTFPVNLDINAVDGDGINQVAPSVLPKDPGVYYHISSGTIYPYICNTQLPHVVPLISYLKRELPGTIKDTQATVSELGRKFETMFEAIIRRVMEYNLQIHRQIPQITDICLGCPTVFNNKVISDYRTFLKNVCSHSMIQPSPTFEITVWDEIWAAFSQINSRSNLDDGYYLLWDMGGGTTDIVMIAKSPQDGVSIIGFNSDYYGGKDVNSHIRSLIPKGEGELVTETEIDSLKTLLITKKDDFYTVPMEHINRSLEGYCRDNLRAIAKGLVSSLQNFGVSPSHVNIVTLGGGSLLRILGEYEDTLSLADLIKDIMEELMPDTSFDIKTVSVDPKGCTSLGLANLANTPYFKDKINRLPGFEKKSRYNIVHRDVFGTNKLVLAIGQNLDSASLIWENGITRSFMVFGGSNLDDAINPPVVYGNPAAWSDFLRILKPLSSYTTDMPDQIDCTQQEAGRDE